MAKYHHLPIYKTAYDLLLELMHATKDFPREFKFSIGEKVQEHIVGLLIDIYRANSAKEKTSFIISILEHVQYLEIFLRMAYDLRILPQTRYCAFIEKTTSIAKQSQGWLTAMAILPR